MYISKSLYETLPYLYIASSVAVFAMKSSSLIYLSTALLYAVGALVWVTRSAYRRKNSKHRIMNRKDRFRFPERLYEYLPFLYLAAGLIAVVKISGPYGVIFGGVLCLAGVLVWIIRAIYRSQPRPHIHA